MSDIDATAEQIVTQDAERIVRDAMASHEITVNSPEDWYRRMVGLEPDLSPEVQWTAWTLALCADRETGVAQVSLVRLGRLAATEFEAQTGNATAPVPGHRVRKVLHTLRDRGWLMIRQGGNLGPASANIYTLNVPEVN